MQNAKPAPEPNPTGICWRNWMFEDGDLLTRGIRLVNAHWRALSGSITAMKVNQNFYSGGYPVMRINNFRIGRCNDERVGEFVHMRIDSLHTTYRHHCLHCISGHLFMYSAYLLFILWTQPKFFSSDIIQSKMAISDQRHSVLSEFHSLSIFIHSGTRFLNHVCEKCAEVQVRSEKMSVWLCVSLTLSSLILSQQFEWKLEKPLNRYVISPILHTTTTTTYFSTSCHFSIPTNKTLYNTHLRYLRDWDASPRLLLSQPLEDQPRPALYRSSSKHFHVCSSHGEVALVQGINVSIHVWHHQEEQGLVLKQFTRFRRQCTTSTSCVK